MILLNDKLNAPLGLVPLVGAVELLVGILSLPVPGLVTLKYSTQSYP